jgi:hypothetical protein
MKKIIFFVFALLFATNTFSQITEIADGIFSKGNKLLGNGLTKKLQRDPITSSFTDCDKTKTLPVEFGAEQEKKLLCNQLFVKDSGFKLTAGYYKSSIKSFCLKAGTFGPSKGNGYLYAPIKGSKKDVVNKLITNWKNHEEVTQSQLQLLLWAIIAKTKFNNLSNELKIVATKLLSDGDMKELSKVGLDFVSGELMKKAIAQMPESAQKIISAENEMRQKFYATTISYQEMENLAMLAGIAPANSEINEGLWSLLPNGCYIKFLPQGYSKTTIEIYVPENLNGKISYIDLATIIAMPAYTGCQRLVQSNMLFCENIK